jgi:hypothetical protein
MAEDRYVVRHAELWLGTLVEIGVEAPPSEPPEAGIAAAFAAIARGRCMIRRASFRK